MDDELLKRIAKWAPVPPFDVSPPAQAISAFTDAVTRSMDARAMESGDYTSYSAVYVYKPFEVVRHPSPDGGICAKYPNCLLFYFSTIAPIAAVGLSSWQENLRPDGSWSSRGYGGLDTTDLISWSAVSPGPLKLRMEAALKLGPYQVMEPDFFLQPAPAWFKPLQRSEGVEPWNRLFHLFFQFND